MTHDAHSEEAVFDGLEDHPVQSSDLLRVGEYFFTCVLEVLIRPQPQVEVTCRFCVRHCPIGIESGKPRRCSVARLDCSTREGTDTSLLFHYCVTIFSFALTGCGRSARTGANLRTYISSVRPYFLATNICTRSSISASIRTTPFDDGQTGAACPSSAALLRQRDTCTLVLATEAREAPNTHSLAHIATSRTTHGTEWSVAVRDERDSHARGSLLWLLRWL